MLFVRVQWRFRAPTDGNQVFNGRGDLGTSRYILLVSRHHQEKTMLCCPPTLGQNQVGNGLWIRKTVLQKLRKSGFLGVRFSLKITSALAVSLRPWNILRHTRGLRSSSWDESPDNRGSTNDFSWVKGHSSSCPRCNGSWPQAGGKQMSQIVFPNSPSWNQIFSRHSALPRSWYHLFVWVIQQTRSEMFCYLNILHLHFLFLNSLRFTTRWKVNIDSLYHSPSFP